jgi:hypothetical protein
LSGFFVIPIFQKQDEAVDTPRLSSYDPASEISKNFFSGSPLRRWIQKKSRIPSPIWLNCLLATARFAWRSGFLWILLADSITSPRNSGRTSSIGPVTVAGNVSSAGIIQIPASGSWGSRSCEESAKA